MSRSKFLMFAAVAVACAGFLTLSQPADARLMDGPDRVAAALSAMRLSDDAMALAGIVVLVCSNHVACGR